MMFIITFQDRHRKGTIPPNRKQRLQQPAPPNTTKIRHCITKRHVYHSAPGSGSFSNFLWVPHSLSYHYHLLNVSGERLWLVLEEQASGIVSFSNIRQKPYILQALVVQSWSTLCDPMDCSPSGSSVHRILQARILEKVAISFSRGSSWSRDPLQADSLPSEPPGKPIHITKELQRLDSQKEKSQCYCNLPNRSKHTSSYCYTTNYLCSIIL